MWPLLLSLLVLGSTPLSPAGATTELYTHHVRSHHGKYGGSVQLVRDNDLKTYRKFVYWTILDTYRQLEKEESPVSALEVNEEIIKTIGINGMMDIIEEEDPSCHGLAHQVGRAAVRVTKDIKELVTACGLRCHTGCFHGVALGLIVDQPDDSGSSDRMSTVFQALCNNSHVVDEYGKGECLHAAGHTAAMVAGEENMDRGIEICMVAYAGQPVLQHYCGTGVFMQVKPHRGLETCANTVLPGACFMYSWRYDQRSLHFAAISGMGKWAVVTLRQCLELKTETSKAGCIYGLAANLGERTIMHEGKGRENYIEDAAKAAAQLCREVQGELLAACVEGFLLRNMKYYPPEALPEICQLIGSVTDYTYNRCVTTGRMKMYDFDRNVARYVAGAQQPSWL